MFATYNPFRYRGYFYCTEMGLYFLKTRFYDPEIGQFISPDTPDYLDPTVSGGVHLYSYCGNNPVNNIDPDGHAFLSIFVGALVAGAVFGAVSGGAKAVMSGESVWKGLLVGFLKGAVIGGAFGLGAGIAVTATGAAAGLAGLSFTIAGSFSAGMGIYALETKLYNREFSTNDMILSGFNLSIKASANYGIGYLMGAKGLFRQSAKLNTSNALMLIKSMFFKFRYALPSLLERSYLKIATVTIFSMIVDGLFKDFYLYEKN